jgi:hypothetical protein
LFYSESELVPWPTDRWCKLDWVEQQPCKSALEPVATDPGEFIYDERLEFKKYRYAFMIVNFFMF